MKLNWKRFLFANIPLIFLQLFGVICLVLAIYFNLFPNAFPSYVDLNILNFLGALYAVIVVPVFAITLRPLYWHLSESMYDTPDN